MPQFRPKRKNGVLGKTKNTVFTGKNGTPDRDRTCDPLLRRQLLYPTELRALQKTIQKPSTIFFNAKDSRIEFFPIRMMKQNEPDV